MNPSYGAFEGWLISRLASLSAVDPEWMDIDRAFVDYSLDSSVAVTLAEELSREVGRSLSPTLFWEHPNIRALASALAAAAP